MRPSFLSITALALTATGLPTNSLENASPAQDSKSSFSKLAHTDFLLPHARRQDIDFALAGGLPDPAPMDANKYNQTAAIAAVIADIIADPLPQNRDFVLAGRDGATGHTSSISLGNAAINAPLNCKGGDTYLGSKSWNDNFFIEERCAAACTAQSNYNVVHPPSSGVPKTSQFYNTYILLKNGAQQGQYCSLYTKAWYSSKAMNTGQMRGSDKFTIGSSIIASNATNSGVVSCCTAGNFVSNGGFESFDGFYATDWTPSNANVAVNDLLSNPSDAHSGSQLFTLFQSGQPAAVSQTLSGLRSSDTEYQLVFYYANHLFVSDCTLYVSLGGKSLLTQALPNKSDGNLSYMKVSLGGIFPTTQSEDLTIQMTCGSTAYNSAIFLEDVSFKPRC